MLDLILQQKFLPLSTTLKITCQAEPRTPFTCYEQILSICANFESKYNAGYDEIFCTKSTIQYIISPLTDIINCSFETGIISNDIKIAKVIPFYKSSQKDILPTTALYLFYLYSQRFF